MHPNMGVGIPNAATWSTKIDLRKASMREVKEQPHNVTFVVSRFSIWRYETCSRCWKV